MARDDTEQLVPPPAPGVAFEVDRFEWAGDDRLELVGRWSGLRGHRFLRPTLDVVVDGERRRMLAVLEHKPWAAEAGEEWIAAFTWRGDRATFEEAELTVSPDLAVELPSPGGASRAAKKDAEAVERLPARRPRTAVLEEELAGALSEAQELRDQLRAEQTNVRGLENQIRQAQAELAAAQEERDASRATADELASSAEEAREEAEAARRDSDRAREEAEAARKEADSAAPDVERMRAELVEAERERDAALERAKAAERERTAASEARDRARDERNAWMQRARAVAAGRPSAARAATAARPAEPEPDRELAEAAESADPAETTERPTETLPQPPRDDRRTIQIGKRPGPLRVDPPEQPDAPAWRGAADRWGPRLLAALALVVLAAIVLALVLWAL